MNMNVKTYIIADKKYHIIKVGRSKNPYEHLNTMQLSNCTELEIVCVFEEDIEREIKEFLNKYKVRGDWYFPNPKTLLEIQEKYLPNNQEIASFIDNLFGKIKLSDHPICFCWIDDKESGCQFKQHKSSIITCESYEIWRSCVRKEEINFGN
jgi:hypothetical protein